MAEFDSSIILGDLQVNCDAKIKGDATFLNNASLLGTLTISKSTQYPLVINSNGVDQGAIGMKFQGHPTQEGYFYANHQDSDSQGGNYSFHLGSTEAITNVVLEGGNYYVDSNAVWHAGTLNPSDYLPLAGGTVTGNVSMTATGSNLPSHYYHNLYGEDMVYSHAFPSSHDKMTKTKYNWRTANGAGGYNTLEFDGSGNLSLGGDLKFTGTDSYIWTPAISGESSGFWDAHNSAKMLEVWNGGAVDLYYNGSKKFNTSSGGATVTGITTSTSGFYVGDSNLYLYKSAEGQVTLRTNNSSAWKYFTFRSDGGLHLNGGTLYAGSLSSTSNATIGSGTTGTARITLDVSNAGSPQISLNDTNNDCYWSVGADDADNNFSIHGSTTSQPVINGISTPHFQITTSGSVGIGTNPSYKLHVAGSAKFNTDIHIGPQDGTNEGGAIYLLGAGAYTNSMYLDRYQNKLRMVYNGAERFSVSDSGQVYANNGFVVNGGIITHNTASSYDKIRVYSSNLYTIGFKSAQTYGYLNDYAMTFTMNNDTDRGFLWRDYDDAASDGAMSLTTDGRLKLKSRLSFGGMSGDDRYISGNGNYLRIQTPYGYTDIGSNNSSWSHMNTDRAGFYFNKKVHAVAELRVYNTNTYLTSTSGYINGKKILTEGGSGIFDTVDNLIWSSILG